MPWCPVPTRCRQFWGPSLTFLVRTPEVNLEATRVTRDLWRDSVSHRTTESGDRRGRSTRGDGTWSLRLLLMLKERIRNQGFTDWNLDHDRFPQNPLTSEPSVMEAYWAWIPRLEFDLSMHSRQMRSQIFKGRFISSSSSLLSRFLWLDLLLDIRKDFI